MANYCVHFEPLTDLNHGNESPSNWVVRLYEGDDGDACFQKMDDYVASGALHCVCSNIAEAKGLTKRPTRPMMLALLKALPSIGVKYLIVRHKRRVNVYEVRKYADLV